MVATIRCYYNTGLTPSNCLDSSSLLDSLGFEYKDFPNIAIKQDRGIIDIRINTTYDNIKDADYCKINNNCYWITGIVMINDNVAEVVLQQDCLTTIGIYPLFKLNVISGWCTRRHVLNDDEFINILDEPFTPTNELVIDPGTVISGSDDTGYYSIVLSTVDLLNITDTAKAYFDKDNDKILVPELPNVQGTNTTYISNLVTPAKSANIALSNAFNAENTNVQSGMKAVRQLGIESCIGAAYMLPKAWAEITDNNGLITSITDKSRFETSAIKTTWKNPSTGLKYKNNKVFSGQFQKIIVFSLASGDSCENRVEDIINNDTKQIIWVTYADTRYSGRPGCKPRWFKDHENTALMQSIHGANWQQTPFIYNYSSGAGFTLSEYYTKRMGQFIQAGNNLTSGILNIASSWGSAALNPMSNFGNKTVSIRGDNLAQIQAAKAENISANTSGLLGIAGSALNYINTIGPTQINRQLLNIGTNASILSNDIKFPQVPNMADYVGNAFYDLRYRLSDNDMTRFDNFLTAYGYAVDEPLKAECFAGREHFNFLQARDVSLKIANAPQYLIDGMAKQIEAGVRIWHKAPSGSAFIDNPIISGGE